MENQYLIGHGWHRWSYLSTDRSGRACGTARRPDSQLQTDTGQISMTSAFPQAAAGRSVRRSEATDSIDLAPQPGPGAA